MKGEARRSKKEGGEPEPHHEGEQVKRKKKKTVNSKEEGVHLFARSWIKIKGEWSLTL